MKLITEEKLNGLCIRILQYEETKQWYCIDIYHTMAYDRGIRIEGTKQDMQKLVDVLNIGINHNENESNN
jgi:hypothetical protein